jgi:anti-sigma B factor antagonist
VALSVDVGTGSTGQPTIALHGELDQAGAPALREAVDNALATGPEGLRLDLARLTFVDSSGLGAIVKAHQRAADLGCRLVLDGVSANLYERLQITGLADLLEVSPPSA